MNIQFYNDLSGRKEPFEPLVPGEVSFYVCGPTVYDYFHLGNARPFMVFDVLRRYLESRRLKVSYVQNFTDIDDKMIQRAAQSGTTVAELAERFIAAYYEDADALGIRRATVNPRATHEIDAIISMIEKLVKNGRAYASEDGVYYEVDKFPGYGKLSKQNLDDLRAGARVDISEHKRSPLDFALWKAQKPGEPAWESPWGMGRPGWHIECSAMASRHLGETIDIHGGGSDLMFPHHENEIAQSEGAHGAAFARFWLHNGYLMIDREKMSKSLGNFFTARDLLKKFPAAVLRLFMLSAHYRSPINFSEENIEQARHALSRLRNGASELTFALAADTAQGEPDETLRRAVASAEKLFDDSMSDDFNTAGAIGALFDLVRATNVAMRRAGAPDRAGLEGAMTFLRRADDVMGIFEQDSLSGDVARGEASGDDARIEALIEERAAARKAKNFARSDEIRDELAAMGVILEDTPNGTRWKRSS